MLAGALGALLPADLYQDTQVAGAGSSAGLGTGAIAGALPGPQLPSVMLMPCRCCSASWPLTWHIMWHQYLRSPLCTSADVRRGSTHSCTLLEEAGLVTRLRPRQRTQLLAPLTPGRRCAGIAVGAAVVVAVTAAVLCAVLMHRRRAAAALAAKVRQESQGVAMVDGFSHADSYGPESGPLAPPGPGHRGLWFYEQLHASLVRPPSRGDIGHACALGCPPATVGGSMQM